VPSPQSIAEYLHTSYAEWKVAELTSRRFSHDELWMVLDRIIDRGLFGHREVGRSFEGRPIKLISVGEGATTLLLWSQMHGDESTATMAIADILNYFRLFPNEKFAKTILSSPARTTVRSGGLHLLFLPMLNPDGAARFQRRTAQAIDMNRDALALQTPEARILKQLQEQYKPAFGFNLHDQELCTVGDTKELTAIAVLAPAFNEKKSDNEVRIRAKHLGATFAAIMNGFVPGKIARYDDAFEPRAFGDAMQRWGTSTVLIESGHMPNDPEKHSVRQLNAVGILASLYAIASGEYMKSDTLMYDSLPFNSKRAYDVIIRNVRLQHQNGAMTFADMGISYQVDTHTEDTPVLVDLGDLSTFVGLREIDGGKKTIPQNLLLIGKPFAWEKFFS
jgi:hypothetical protein